MSPSKFPLPESDGLGGIRPTTYDRASVAWLTSSARSKVSTTPVQPSAFPSRFTSVRIGPPLSKQRDSSFSARTGTGRDSCDFGFLCIPPPGKTTIEQKSATLLAIGMLHGADGMARQIFCQQKRGHPRYTDVPSIPARENAL